MISIIIPTYNRARFLEATLPSIQGQVFANWECIVIDDGSTDTTQQLVTAIAQNDARFQYIQRPSQIIKGAPSCRNIGLSMAKGDYVLFFDSDDLLAPETLQNRVAVIKEHPGLDFWVFQTIKFHTLPGDTPFIWNPLDGSNSNDLKEFLAINPVWHTSGPVFSRTFLTTNALHYTQGVLSWQDWEFHVRVLLCTSNYFKSPELSAAAYQRFHSGDAINKHSSLSVELDRLTLFANLITTFKEKERFSREIQYYFLKLYYFILSRNFNVDSSVQYWDIMVESLPDIAKVDACFWKQYLLHKKTNRGFLFYKKRKLLNTLKEVYFSKRFPVDDFTNRTWYKLKHT